MLFKAFFSGLHFFFCSFQAVWVFTVSLPVIFVNAPEGAYEKNDFTVQDGIGLALFLIGLLIESVSDIQKFTFRNEPSNKGKWCDKGINTYFGL